MSAPVYPMKVTLCGPGPDGTPLAAGSATVDGSGTITAGGTAQTALAANTARRWLFILNVADVDLWVNFGVAAVADQPSILIPSGGYFEPLVAPTGLVSVIGATTGKKFVCKEA